VHQNKLQGLKLLENYAFMNIKKYAGFNAHYLIKTLSHPLLFSTNKIIQKLAFHLQKRL